MSGGAAFDVLDALDGFATLTKRTPTLDGAVPLRVAQACVPLLEGNALGFQVVLRPGISLRRRLGRVVVDVEPTLRAALEVARLAAVPRLVAQGFLERGGAWEAQLARRGVWVERGRARLWTGLLVRARDGIWLRVTSAANRRSVTFDVDETYVADDDQYVPLVLDLSLASDRASLHGEVACVTPVSSTTRVTMTALAAVPSLGRAHAAFYDEAYFDRKKTEVTGKYRKLVARDSRGGAEEGHLEVAKLGPLDARIAHADRFLDPRSTTLRAGGPDDRPLASLIVANTVGFRAVNDGQSLVVTPDQRALAAAASHVERTWTDVFGDGSVERDRRALWYLTKYFTPHPPGDPHFFVKPFALVRTSPGWSTIVDGLPGPGYEVLRGVIATDRFFATPAVFHVLAPGREIDVLAGVPLIKLIPIPRHLLDATFHRTRFHDDARVSSSRERAS